VAAFFLDQFLHRDVEQPRGREQRRGGTHEEKGAHPNMGSRRLKCPCRRPFTPTMWS
jgi:hypothetical protein